MSLFPARMKKIDPIQNEGGIECSQHALMAGDSLDSGRIWLKFELIQAFMHVLIACKNEEEPNKNEGTSVFTTFLPLSLWGYFRCSRAAKSGVHGPIRLNFKLSCPSARMKTI